MKPRIAETLITINAPIEKVWQVMLNVNDYPAWNPFVVKVETQADVSRPGTAMKLFVKWNDGGSATSGEVIEEAVAPVPDGFGIKRAQWSYRFTGPLDKLGLVHAIRFQWLEQRAEGVTMYHTREEFTGLLRAFIPLAKVQNGFERQAKALAKYVE